MLFKLSLSNLKKSLKDYAIYFFTLIIGVAVFYVFNSVGAQATFISVLSSQNDIIVLLDELIAGLSIFVAGVLGLLIAYASRFLMKRRNKEFALYMLLGMSKGKISFILLIETLLIGAGSLVCGLLIGIGLSQFMSALVASLFEADMSALHFMVSGKSIAKTVIYFSIMYVVVMIFNTLNINKLKLIDLLQSGRRSEKLRMKNPWVCSIIFIVSAIALAICYRKVAFDPAFFSGGASIVRNRFLLIVAVGCAATFLIFLSVSGLLLRVAMSLKSRYYRSLNSFTFRQLSSKVTTMVFSMTVICLMLFVTISALAASFSLRSSMNANIVELCPADVEIGYNLRKGDELVKSDLIADMKKYGLDLTENFSDYVSLHYYVDDNLTMRSSMGEFVAELSQQYRFLMWDSCEPIVTLGDYNRLMDLYGRKHLEMADDEYIVLCNFANMKGVRDFALKQGVNITAFGKTTLKPKYDECQDGFIELSSQPLNSGIIVIPDSAADPDRMERNYVIGKYKAVTKDGKRETDTRVKEQFDLFTKFQTESVHPGIERLYNYNTKSDIADSTVGLTAIITFLGLYIGMVFLISCGAILALKELSDSTDSIPRYEILRKIGAEENEISKSLFVQTGIFFLLPLILGAIHSVFGLKFAMNVFEVLGMDKLVGPVTATAIIIVLVYGGYFLITYFSDKAIIRTRR
ncbi:MAG: ABC transporter permease [Lachnospiraceae bacterium]|nr:ABC transporter permease [Lachnospiraceae bacterium]